MTVTFTQLNFKIQSEFANIDTINILKELEGLGTGNMLNIDVSLHITGSNADLAKDKLKNLYDLGILLSYKHNELQNQIESFKRLYLK